MEEQFCEVCLSDRKFERIEIEENVEIRSVNFKVLHEYDKCTECKELFEPYEDVDKNIKKDYFEYRKKVGYLNPEQIKAIRKKYTMSMRDFAAILGIGYSTLSNIENGALQNDYQNTLFEFASSPSAMYKITLKKKDFLDVDLESVIRKIEMLCISEEPQLEELKNKISQTLTRLDEKDIYITRTLNTLQYDVDKLNKQGTSSKEGTSTWTKKIMNMMPQL